ncbi:peroxiredoxin-like family protein [Nocardia sp. NPDC050406]|uniref:peroxiredoxin-like family protein n=1 Tax=Nocardia sp. NPDC050406 TaxID=3364318 RepID=UPI0037B2EE1F
MARIDIGDMLTPRTWQAIDGTEISIPDPERLVHLQFRRFAGCPICHLHLRTVARRHDEIAAVGVAEIVVFHSDAPALRRYQADLPFAVIADPERALYTEFGVDSSPMVVVDPRAWAAAAKGVLHQRSLTGALGLGEDHFGRPADFLVAPDGRVLARKYGSHADDQWPVDEILALAARFRST